MKIEYTAVEKFWVAKIVLSWVNMQEKCFEKIKSTIILKNNSWKDDFISGSRFLRHKWSKLQRQHENNVSSNISSEVDAIFISFLKIYRRRNVLKRYVDSIAYQRHVVKTSKLSKWKHRSYYFHLSAQYLS